MSAELVFLADVLVRATPLLLAGLAVAIAFRAGVMNIGAEGQLLMGATAGAAVATVLPAASGGVGVVLALVAGALAGSVWAAIAAVLRRRFSVLEVISTIMLNFIAVHLVGFLVRGPMQEPLRIYPQTVELPAAFQLPRFFSGSRLHLGFLLAVVIAVLAWWLLERTASGFRLRAVGANPRAAWSAGQVDVEAVTFRAFILSGALAGLAGAVELTGVTLAVYENLSPGYGYTAIAVALIARLQPLWVIPAAVGFGALEIGAATMQRDYGVPSVIVYVIEAAAILAVLASRAVRLRSSIVLTRADTGAVDAAA